MLRELSTRTGTTASRIATPVARTIGRIRQTTIQSSVTRRSADRTRRRAGDDRHGAVGQPRDRDRGGEDGGERPRRQRISERHRASSSIAIDSKYFDDALLVGVGHALAAAGAQPIPGDRARQLAGDRCLGALQRLVHVGGERLPRGVVLLERLGAGRRAAPLVLLGRRSCGRPIAACRAARGPSARASAAAPVLYSCCSRAQVAALAVALRSLLPLASLRPAWPARPAVRRSVRRGAVAAWRPGPVRPGPGSARRALAAPPAPRRGSASRAAPAVRARRARRRAGRRAAAVSPFAPPASAPFILRAILSSASAICCSAGARLRVLRRRACPSRRRACVADLLRREVARRLAGRVGRRPTPGSFGSFVSFASFVSFVSFPSPRRCAVCCIASTRSASCSFSPASRRRASAVPPPSLDRGAPLRWRCGAAPRRPAATRAADRRAPAASRRASRSASATRRSRSCRAASSPLAAAPAASSRCPCAAASRICSIARLRSCCAPCAPWAPRRSLRALAALLLRHLLRGLFRLAPQLLLLARQLLELALHLLGRRGSLFASSRCWRLSSSCRCARSRIRSSALLFFLPSGCRLDLRLALVVRRCWRFSSRSNRLDRSCPWRLPLAPPPLFCCCDLALADLGLRLQQRVERGHLVRDGAGGLLRLQLLERAAHRVDRVAHRIAGRGLRGCGPAPGSAICRQPWPMRRRCRCCPAACSARDFSSACASATPLMSVGDRPAVDRRSRFQVALMISFCDEISPSSCVPVAAGHRRLALRERVLLVERLHLEEEDLAARERRLLGARDVARARVVGDDVARLDAADPRPPASAIRSARGWCRRAS